MKKTALLLAAVLICSILGGCQPGDGIDGEYQPAERVESERNSFREKFFGCHFCRVIQEVKRNTKN